MKKISKEFGRDENIIDIYLTTDIKASDFLYGQSDLNLLIVVTNDCHPKLIINSLRSFINKDFILSLIVNSSYLPIITIKEFSIPHMKSFLVRNHYKKEISWLSIISMEEHIFELSEKEHSNVAISAIQNLDYFLFKTIDSKSTRTKVKNILRDLITLAKFFPTKFHLPAKLIRIGNWIQLNPVFNIFFYRFFIKNTWISLSSNNSNLTSTSNSEKFSISQDLEDHLKELVNMPYINDITLTPSIIQNNLNRIKGKIYLEIHINELFIKKYFSQINNIKSSFKQFEYNNLKLRIRFVSTPIYKIQNSKAYYPYPLDTLYRKYVTYSICNYDYKYHVSKTDLINSSVYFLLNQFMRFRSLEQKTELIGSKFIKSLNLMYRYYLLLSFLKTDRFHFDHSEKKIREVLTPQFSDIKINDRVKPEDWLIIRAQLIYLLKQIRDELSKKYPNLKHLKF